MRLLCRDTAIDLGGRTVRMHVRGRGVVASEPAVLARSVGNDRVLAFGVRALELAARRGDVALVRPISDGVPAEAVEAEILLRRMIHAHHRLRVMAKPRIAVVVPSSLTQVQSRAVREVAFQAGARRVDLVPKPFAAAVGAGVLPSRAEGLALVADIGARLTDVGVTGRGTVVSARVVRVGGIRLDEAIAAYALRRYDVALSPAAAERARRTVGVVPPGDAGRATRVRVPCLRPEARPGPGRTQEVLLTSGDVRRAVAAPLTAVVDTIVDVLATCPPDLAGGLLASGLTLTGGAARMPGLAEFVAAETGMPVRVAADPVYAAVRGAARLAFSRGAAAG
ncbi:rod shape-determining protein [Spirillospora sp. NPDC047279]|uniref:rod shape-determining protein n=1 Tax=Spirillospora sp. NPDC047279 TaxID=3155478 RepID=UPI0033E678CB